MEQRERIFFVPFQKYLNPIQSKSGQNKMKNEMTGYNARHVMKKKTKKESMTNISYIFIHTSIARLTPAHKAKYPVYDFPLN